MRNRAERLEEWFIPLAIVVSLTCCAPQSAPQSTPAESPSWLKTLIANIEAQPPTNPRSSIWRYTYRGVPVYFRPAICCDRFSELFDQHGSVICHPSGGFAGTGDGKCPDFIDSRTDELLIWQDGRAPQ